MRRCLGLVVLLGSGCVRVNLGSGGAAPSVYSLEPPRAVLAPATVDAVVRVSDFTGAPLCETTDMVLVRGDGTVVSASRHRWASAPPRACADILWRDLIASRAVKAAFRRTARVPETVVVDGHLTEFGARARGDQWWAVLDITLTVAIGHGTTAFQRDYRMEQRLATPGYAALAATMTDLVRAWSDEVTVDLRTTMIEPSRQEVNPAPH